ncbi:putative quinol monooxygenase [Aeromicrobium fastidiosum]|uniref:Antibiotic biosynthesis monooxygenase n=1 Tax=Aeromicrobium fastidiosum TaxID=52699 RepID=A0A641ASN0_9ACTN|nr:antibiotic biosynthesis monooxygenase [Aeromicrobium fastidiosum]KAA1380081.1 antibiotic biosynthesis monooxygenase [Aeromicrobium fastidiosum]MBP2389611.1 quinol monooxygenase YgiN [Aeromicrobium fastidiosum]
MTIIATLDLRFDPARLDEARALMHGVLDDTRAFDGNLGVDVLVDVNDPAHWVAYETWESPEHDAAYREFRAGPGAVAAMPPLLAAAPVLTWLEVDDSI